MKSNQFLAHPDQSLVEHLIGVAHRAKGIAAHFQGEHHAELAGLLHDLGKADESFRKRMEAIAIGKPDPGDKKPHAPHGAALALANQLWPVAFAIHGANAKLSDCRRKARSSVNGASELSPSVERRSGAAVRLQRLASLSRFKALNHLFR